MMQAGKPITQQQRQYFSQTIKKIYDRAKNGILITQSRQDKIGIKQFTGAIKTIIMQLGVQEDYYEQFSRKQNYNLTMSIKQKFKQRFKQNQNSWITNYDYYFNVIINDEYIKQFIIKKNDDLKQMRRDKRKNQHNAQLVYIKKQKSLQQTLGNNNQLQAEINMLRKQNQTLQQKKDQHAQQIIALDKFYQNYGELRSQKMSILQNFQNSNKVLFLKADSSFKISKEFQQYKQIARQSFKQLLKVFLCNGSYVFNQLQIQTATSSFKGLAGYLMNQQPPSLLYYIKQIKKQNPHAYRLKTIKDYIFLMKVASQQHDKTITTQKIINLYVQLADLIKELNQHNSQWWKQITPRITQRQQLCFKNILFWHKNKVDEESLKDQNDSLQ